MSAGSEPNKKIASRVFGGGKTPPFRSSDEKRQSVVRNPV